jgi:hypothetical protein
VKQIFDRHERSERIKSETAGTPREVLSPRAYNIVAQYLGLGVGWTREQLQSVGLDGLADHRAACGSRALNELEEYLSSPSYAGLSQESDDPAVDMHP